MRPLPTKDMVNFPPRTTPVTIVILPGDHVGPEVIREACRILEVASSLRAHNYGLSISTVHGLVGGAAIDATGTRVLIKLSTSTRSL